MKSETSKEISNDEVAKYIFDCICKGWAGSQMLFPTTNKRGQRVNVSIYLDEILGVIVKRVKEARDLKFTKIPIK